MRPDHASLHELDITLIPLPTDCGRQGGKRRVLLPFVANGERSADAD